MESINIPHDWKRECRPLSQIVNTMSVSSDITYDKIKNWLNSSEGNKVKNYYEDYPKNCLTIGNARPIMYLLVCALKPENVLEIGTYYCGTSEIIARGLLENGKGILHTTDPFGEKRCQYILNSWPELLRKHVNFTPFNSMDFLLKIEDAGIRPDLVFIDGNHDFEFVSFDLNFSAKLLKPNGIIVLDNIEQPGPFWAGKEFLENNPEWIELGDVQAQFRNERPFDPTRSLIGGTNQMLIQAPSFLALGNRP